MKPIEAGTYSVRLKDITEQGTLEFIVIDKGEEEGKSIFVHPRVFNTAVIDTTKTHFDCVINNITELRY